MFIDKLIDSYDLISNFIPEESALLGYYFGQFFYNCQNKTKHSLNSFDFTKIQLPGEFTIKMIDRNKNIIFGSKSDTETFTLTPSSIYHNNKLLKKFASLHACYIGILAGIESNKINKSILPNKNTNNVKLISINRLNKS